MIPSVSCNKQLMTVASAPNPMRWNWVYSGHAPAARVGRGSNKGRKQHRKMKRTNGFCMVCSLKVLTNVRKKSGKTAQIDRKSAERIDVPPGRSRQDARQGSPFRTRGVVLTHKSRARPAHQAKHCRTDAAHRPPPETNAGATATAGGITRTELTNGGRGAATCPRGGAQLVLSV